MIPSEAQIEFKKDFVKKASREKRASPDTTCFCFRCGYAGDTRDPHSHFDAWIPPIDPNNINRGLMLDAMSLIWFCSSCAGLLRAFLMQIKEKDAGSDF